MHANQASRTPRPMRQLSALSGILLLATLVTWRHQPIAPIWAECLPTLGQGQHSDQVASVRGQQRQTREIDSTGGEAGGLQLVAIVCNETSANSSQAPSENKSPTSISVPSYQDGPALNFNNTLRGKPQPEVVPTSPSQLYQQQVTVKVGRRERRPDRKRLDELVPGDDVSKLLFKNYQPRWMDACNPLPERNDTTVKIHMATLAPATAEEMEADLRDYTFIRGGRRNKSQLQQQQQLQQSQQDVKGRTGPPERRKRDVAAHKGPSNEQQQHQHQHHQTMYKFQDSDKSAILFKGGRFNKRTTKWGAPKKTTFALSSPLSLPPKSRQQRQFSKTRFVIGGPQQTVSVVPTSTPPTLVVESPITMPEPSTPEEQKKRLAELLMELFHLDVKMSWHLIGTHATVSNVIKHHQVLIDAIRGDQSYRQEADLSEERAEEILRERSKWLPRFEDLVVGEVSPASLYNITGGLQNPKFRDMMVNMTHYMQFFNVALEQMKFDQAYQVREPNKSMDFYKNVDDNLRKLLCDTESYLRLERQYLAKKGQFLKLYNSFELSAKDKKLTNLEGIEVFYDRFMNNKLVRDRPDQTKIHAIESAITRAFDVVPAAEQSKVLRKMETFLPENMRPFEDGQLDLPPEERRPPVIVRHLSRPSHAWRELMPLEQRQLYSGKERALRDTSILLELSPLLKAFESLIRNNFI